MSSPRDVGRAEWSDRISRALAELKGDPARLLAVPLAATLAGGCYSTASYRQTGNPNDYATTTTTTSGATIRTGFQSDESRREERAREAQRLEREMAERREAARGPEASTDLQTGLATQGERATFFADLRTAIAEIDASSDDLRARAAMAGPTERAHVDDALRPLFQKRAQLEMVTRRLERATAAEWPNVRDEAEAMVEEAKLLLRRASASR